MSSSDRRFPPIAHAAFLVGALVAVTALVALEPAWLARFDQAVVRRTFEATSGNGARESFWLRDATLQGPEVTRIGLALAAIALGLTGERRRAVWLVAVVAIQAIVAPASKLLLDRPRPAWDDPITTLASSSYPSGHAAAAGMLLAVVWVATEASRSAPRAVARLLALAWVALVVADRLSLGVHFPTDLVGGVLLGMSLVAVADVVVPWRPAAGATPSGGSQVA